MDDRERRRLALEFLETFSGPDVEAVLARMTPEPAWAFFANRFPGRDGVRAIHRASKELYREGSHDRRIDGLWVDGDTVLVKTTLRARTFKDEDYENLYMMILHFEGDRIALVEEMMDTAYANEKFAGWQMGD